MLLKDLFDKDSEINMEQPKYFFASRDIEIFGLLILKDDFVNWDGQSFITVNKIPFLFIENECLKKSLNWKTDLTLKNNCDYEILDLEKDLGDSGIWHKDHMDVITMEHWSTHNDRIKKDLKMNINGIEFSSIYYKFNTINRELVHFINTKPFEISIGNKQIEIPEYIEIRKGNDCYNLISLTNSMEIQKVKWGKFVSIYEDGTITGENGEDFDALVNNNLMTISTGIPITLTSKGEVYISLINDNGIGFNKHIVKKLII